MEVVCYNNFKASFFFFFNLKYLKNASQYRFGHSLKEKKKKMYNQTVIRTFYKF